MNDKSTINNYEVTSSFVSDCASLKWTLTNFSSCNLREKIFRSPEFFSSDATWVLGIYLSVDFVEIYLFLIASQSDKKAVSWNISIQDKNGADCFVLKNNLDFNGARSGFAAMCMIDRKLLLEERRDEVLPNDTLTIFCQLNVGFSVVHSPVTRLWETEPATLHPRDDASLEKLVTDFKKVFENQKYCDVVLLSSDGQKFPAHKVILEERSSVFAAMFQHDMAESRHGEVRIEDIDGPILKHLLHYIYTAKVDEIADGDVSRLFVAADKYNIECLKKTCVHHILGNMSVANVCDAIVLADMFKEEQLKESALAFFRKEAHTVITSDFWKEFVKEHSKLAAEMLEIIVLNQKI